MAATHFKTENNTFRTLIGHGLIPILGGFYISHVGRVSEA